MAKSHYRYLLVDSVHKGAQGNDITVYSSHALHIRYPQTIEMIVDEGKIRIACTAYGVKPAVQWATPEGDDNFRHYVCAVHRVEERRGDEYPYSIYVS